MAFVKIVRGSQVPDGASARLAFSEKGKASLTLIVDRTLPDKLKWKAGNVIGIEAGTDEDEGKVRLATAVKGWKLANHAKSDRHFSIKAAIWWKAAHMRGLTSSALIECKSEVVGGALIVCLPKGWFSRVAAEAAPTAASSPPSQSSSPSKPFDMNKLSTRRAGR